MIPNQQTQPGAMNLAHLQQSSLNVMETICSILTRPVEVILRPWHGSRYFPLPVVAMSSVMMVLLPLTISIVASIAGIIPFIHTSHSIGIFDLASFAKIYFILTAIHTYRLFRRMTNMHLEDHSTFEGPPLLFLTFIPWCQTFWSLRIVIEPVFVFLAATVLHDLFIIQSDLAIYLYVAACALAMKNFVSWYRAWEYLRDVLDGRNATPIIAKLANDSATDQELASVNLASFPKGVDPSIRAEAVVSIARAYNPNN